LQTRLSVSTFRVAFLEQQKEGGEKTTISSLTKLATDYDRQNRPALLNKNPPQIRVPNFVPILFVDFYFSKFHSDE
jgi:hypothetical protein